MNLSAEQFRTLMSNKQAAKDRFEGKQKKSKYNNVRVGVDGEKFDSKKEADRYGVLLLLEKKGEITNLKKQVTYRLEVNGYLICKYIADFTYNIGETLVVEDTKSIVTRKLRVYLIKKALMKAIYNIEIKES